MFTLEDIGLAEDLEFIRENGSQFLPQDLRQSGRHGVAPEEGETDPDADAISHPYDYLIVR